MILAAAKTGMDSNAKQEVHVTTPEMESSGQQPESTFRSGSLPLPLTLEDMRSQPVARERASLEVRCLASLFDWSSGSSCVSCPPGSCQSVEAQTLLATAPPKTLGKAHQGLRAALLHHMAVQTNRLIPGTGFPLFAAFVFPLIEDDCEHTPSPISHSC